MIWNRPAPTRKAPKAAVFGVMWDRNDPATRLTRLTPLDDPNRLVTVAVDGEPVPAVGTEGGSSPFDGFMPWAGMEEYNIIGTEPVGSGDDRFSRTENDTVVYIPEFYYAVVDSGGKRCFYIGGGEAKGLEKHPGSGKYVGRYATGTGCVSKSGLAPLTRVTRGAAREESAGKGEGWQQWGYDAWCAVALLYLVEFADWDSQTKVGRGYAVGNRSAVISGKTDGMTYHTGRAAGTDGKTQMQYRHIEGLWGNVSQWVDGVNCNDGALLVCLDPAKYADDTEENYTVAGTMPGESGYIKAMGLSANMPWSFFPEDTAGGADGTYIPDSAATGVGWRALHVGGGCSVGTGGGLWYFNAGQDAATVSSSNGSRLLFATR